MINHTGYICLRC